MSKRGFTLVELAIAMVVLGLLVSVALGPMRERLRNADIRETNETLVAASEAVVAYAIRHSTSGRVNLGQFNGRNWPIHAGRPYLPCPDTDGDGVEDRKVIPISEDEIPAAEIGEEERGGCDRNKGMLPWRTIGGPASDKWGTHLTYRVDPNFSHGALGFDQRTRAESMDTLMAIQGGGLGGFGDKYPKRGVVDAPSVVCLTHDCMVGAAAKIALDYTQPTGDEDLGTFLADLKIGLVVIPEELEASPTKIFERAEFMDAPAFVILSHGRNQFGGVLADSDPGGPPGNVKRCVPMDDDDDPHELQNAFYYFDAADPHPLANPVNGSECYTRMVLPPLSPLSEAVFVDRPPAAGFADGARTMDDIVTWMSPNRLSRRLMEAGVFPADELEFLPE